MPGVSAFRMWKKGEFRASPGSMPMCKEISKYVYIEDIQGDAV